LVGTDGHKRKIAYSPFIRYSTETQDAQLAPSKNRSTKEWGWKDGVHSGGGFGIFGMGVLFEEMGPEQNSTIDAWLRKLSGRPGKDLGKNSFSQTRN
jgi:hypothetical protein